MKVLIACEYSGIVRDAFIKLGHNAWSCDVLPTESGGNHIQENVLNVLNDDWDLMIAHPPCTYFSRAAGRVLYNKNRLVHTKKAFEFVNKLWGAEIDKICIENPPGWLCTNWKRPSQKVHPWYFGDKEMKETCFWLKNLPRLNGNINIARNPLKFHPKPESSRMGSDGKIKNKYFVSRVFTAKERSKTFPGIAAAMAEQWSK